LQTLVLLASRSVEDNLQADRD